MKKSQLKEAVKAVVRQCLNERCGSYKLIREKKEASKASATPPASPPASPPVAVPPVAPSVSVPPVAPPVVPPVATPPVAEDQPAALGKESPSSMGAKLGKSDASVGKTNNKPLKEGQVGVGANVVTDEVPEETDTDSNQIPIDDIVRFVIHKMPEISGDPSKVAKVAGLLFQKQTGWGPPDHETLLGVVRNNIQGGSSESQAECGGMEEAGLTSETGAEGGEGYDEKEEIMLIKVMGLITKKLEAMHAGMPGSEVDPSSACPAAGGEEEPAEEPSPFGPDSDLPLEPEEPSEPSFGGGENEPEEEEPSEEPSSPPFGSGEKEPKEKSSEKPEKSEKPKEPKKDDKKDKKDKKKEFPVKEAAYKQIAPRAATDAKEDKARRIQREPKVNETTTIKAGPQYKVQSPRQARVQPDDQLRRISFDPQMTEDKEYGAGANNSCPRCKTVLANKNGKLYCDNPNCMHSRRGHSFKSGSTLVEPKIKENAKVQARSYKTVNDLPNDPNNVRDPEIPLT